MEPDVSLVLITWNSARYLRRCLEGALAQLGVRVDLLIIDNASSDASLQIARECAPQARIVANADNRGFAAAVNQAIALTSSKFVALLNPDVWFSARYLETVIDAVEREGDRVGSASGKLLRAEGEQLAATGEIDSLGIRMTRSGRHFDDHNGARDFETHGVTEVFGVSGAAAVYRRAFLEDVAIDGEVFDERFFAYREDAEIAWRGRLRGWRSLIVHDAVAHHVRRVTPEVRASLPAAINMHSVKNRFLLRFNNEGRHLALRNAPWELTRDLLVLGGVLLRERSSFPAFLWLWQHRREIMQRRARIQARRTVHDQELAHWFR